MPPEANFGVDSYHLNVGSGDCSIHLKIEKAKSADGKPTCLAAVLIDGGQTRLTPLITEYIKQTIKELEANYAFPNYQNKPNRNLRFDAIVVTHWHEDHVNGVIQLVREDISEQAQKTPTPTIIDVSFMKYNPATTPRKPLTYIYFPYWEKSTLAGAGKNPRGARQYQEFVRKTPKVNSRLDFTGTHDTSKWWDSICLVEHERSGLLGVNFFNNKRLKKGDVITTPADLLSKNPPGVAQELGHPAMYCIAHDGVMFPTTTLAPMVIKESDSVENRSSIAAIVMWKSDKPSGRISHYTAGDLTEVAEEGKLVEWLKDYRVVSMKASHHGARQSFPPEIIMGNWKPKTIVISCGEKDESTVPVSQRQGSYNHPRWELIFWLYLALRAENMVGATKVFCTCYPYYFTETNGSYPSATFSVDALVSNDKHFVEYRKLLSELHEKLAQLGLNEMNIKDEFDQYLQTNPSSTKQMEWVVKKTIPAWKALSDVPDTAQAFFGAKSSANKTIAKDTNVQYVLVRSRSDEGMDGQAWHKIFGGTWIKEPVGVKSPSTQTPKPKKAEKTAAASKPSASADKINNPELQLPGPSRPKSGDRKNNIPEKAAEQLAIGTDNATINPVVAAPEAVTVSDPRFYIYAHEVSAPDQNIHIATDEQHIALIGKVHRQVIVLETVLPPDDQGTIMLDDSDEMYAWLQDSLGATISARGEHPDIQHFSLEMAVTEQTLTFDTEAAALQFKLDDIGSTVGTWGLLSGYNVMVFGLQSELSGITLGDVFMQMLEIDLPVALEGLETLSLNIAAADEGIPDSLYQRNALWFIPGENYSTVLRLQLQVPQVADLNKLLASFLGGDGSFSITAAQLIAKKSMGWSLEADGLFVRANPDATFMGTATINAKMTLDFSFSFSGDGGWKAALGYNGDGSGFDEILEWLASLVNVSLDFNNWIPADVLRAVPKFRRVEIFGTPDKTIAGFRVDFESQLKFGGEDDEVTLVLLSYAWPSNTLSGTLWQQLPSDLPNVLRPNFESSSYIPPPESAKITDRLSLSKLNPGGGSIVDIPEQVFPYVDFASLEISPTGITFTGSLVWDAEEKPSAIPMANLATVALYASYDWKDKTFELALHASMTLPLRESSQSLGYPRATLEGVIGYANQTWTFHAGAYGLNIAALYEFFDSDSRDGVMDMLETMEIEQLSLDGTFSKGKLTTLVFKGAVLLGGVRADLAYTYSLSGWSFDIGLGARDASATIGDIVGSIVGPGFVLPACVSSIVVSKTPQSKIFSISVDKVIDPKLGTYVVFKGNFQVDFLGFTFVQMKKSGVKQFTKRAIKVAVAQLPTVTLPLVGDMPQPFDELAFLWVDDASPTTGLTREEVLLLNTYAFAQGTAGIRFKEPKTAGQQDTDVVVRAGLHFLVTLNLRGESKVILDHRFGSTKKAGNSMLALATTADQEMRALNTTSITGGDGEVTTAPMGKTLGALTISNIGLQYKNDTLNVILDASFQLGPMVMTLIGFGIGVAFDGKNTVQSLPSELTVSLQGLGVGFNKPPIVMNGLFQYTKTSSLEMYSGAMTVSFRPYALMAAGFYGTANNQYKTVFVFARLAGPLVQLEFAEISGVCAGFGYNNTVQQPSVQEVATFPFIGGNIQAGANPLEALAELTKPDGWVAPRPDTFWLAAGLDVKALRLISLDAVVIVEFNPYVKLGIYAVCRGSLPPNSPADKSFLFIEFGILASIDFEAGIFKVEGQLSPNSFILAPSCHLQGGFALFYWFNGSQYDGDWVFSVGGYHPAYTPLPHYPTPPRLGISWTLGGGISVRGQSYFAITPKCCMAGGQLNLALALGPLSAWLDAATHFLINYNPFHFMASVSISVGVAFTLDLWIVTIHIKVEIGARLELAGPPFQGLVHVDFWVFGFDIYFGAEPEPPQPVTLEEFWQLLLQQGVPEKRGTTFAMKRRLRGPRRAAAADAGQDHIFAIDSGLVPSAENKDDNSLWVVRAGILVFMVQSRFAIEEATCSPSDGRTAKGPDTPFYAKPMQLTTGISSTMAVTITKQEATFAEEIDKWRIEPILKSVPVAIWGKYSKATDPQMSGNNIDALLSAKDATMQLMMGASIKAPKPTLALDKIPKFNLVHAMAQDVYKSGQNPPFPPTPPEQKPAWVPAAPGSDPSDQYDRVKAQWGDPKAGKDAGKIVLASWIVAFRWATKDTVGMTGALPVRAVEKLGQIYMAAPLLSSG